MTAPCSTVLNGYTFTPVPSTACSPDEALVAEHHALLAAHAAAQVAGAADGGAAEAHGLAEVGVVVDDDPLEVGVGAHADVGAEHRVGPEPHPGLDAAVLADHGRARPRWRRGGSRPPPPRGRRRPSRSRGPRRARGRRGCPCGPRGSSRGCRRPPSSPPRWRRRGACPRRGARGTPPRRSRPARSGAMKSKISGSSTKMPVLIVSLNTWPHDGFSRNRSMEPSSRVITIPNSSGFSTRASPIVASAPSPRAPSRCR